MKSIDGLNTTNSVVFVAIILKLFPLWSSQLIAENISDWICTNSFCTEILPAFSRCNFGLVSLKIKLQISRDVISSRPDWEVLEAVQKMMFPGGFDNIKQFIDTTAEKMLGKAVSISIDGSPNEVEKFSDDYEYRTFFGEESDGLSNWCRTIRHDTCAKTFAKKTCEMIYVGPQEQGYGRWWYGKNSTFEGHFQDFSCPAHGKRRRAHTADVYEGTVRAEGFGEAEGDGQIWWEDGDMFIGKFENNKPVIGEYYSAKTGKWTIKDYKIEDSSKDA